MVVIRYETAVERAFFCLLFFYEAKGMLYAP